MNWECVCGHVAVTQPIAEITSCDKVKLQWCFFCFGKILLWCIVCIYMYILCVLLWTRILLKNFFFIVYLLTFERMYWHLECDLNKSLSFSLIKLFLKNNFFRLWYMEPPMRCFRWKHFFGLCNLSKCEKYVCMFSSVIFRC